MNNGTKAKAKVEKTDRYAGTWLSRSLHAKLQAIARRERRSIAQILEFKVREIVKAGSSGIEQAL
jgi:hypothetical protein